MGRLKDTIMSHDIIYAFPYGYYCPNFSLNSWCNTPVEVYTNALQWSKDGQKAFEIWGEPRPNVNVYNIDNFNISWAFDKTILEKYAKERAKNDV